MIGFRKIVIDKKIWWWKLIKHKVVAYPDGTRNKQLIGLDVLTGIDWAEMERAQWKGYFKVTPADVAKWLKTIKIDETSKTITPTRSKKNARHNAVRSARGSTLDRTIRR